MSQGLNCLRCKAPIDMAAEACPQCGDRVTHFQRTYSARLIDGKYQILERLGQGGMGEIFKVRHIHLNEERVIKIMRANIASDDQSLQRFLQEARTSTMIKHRNLAMLYDFSTLEDGSYYMVWEFIEGTNIQKWVAANGPIPSRLAVEISLQALAGLEHLHSMGLIHRDVSPENIMLSQDYQGKLLAKVIDFGIAKQLSEGGESGSHGLTQTGMFVGKLKYASPEQAGFMREDETIDARSDLYSFGVVFYEMLAGRAPFLATNPQGYILKHVTEKPLPIAQVNPAVKVPPELERIVMKSLEKDRDNRYAFAADFVADLEAIRNQVEPDKTYGLGERMITLTGRTTAGGIRTKSGATLSARPKPGTSAGTFTGGTMGSGTMPGGAGGTVASPVGADGATVVERVGTPTVGADGATVVERVSAQPATMESMRGGTAAATVVEPKVPAWQQPGAEPTVVERKAQVTAAPAKNRMPMIAAVAAVLVIALSAGIWFALHRNPATTIPTPPGTDTTVTGVQPAPRDQAVLLLKSPFGELARIVNIDTNKEVTLSDNSLPLRQTLPPGKYRVIVSGANGEKETTDVVLTQGQTREIAPTPPHDLNTDQIAEDILRQ
jgi:eukaryotic-like serine/threonine-protein kinase